MLCQRHHLGDDADADDDGEDSESVMMGLTQINSGSTIRSDTFESSCAFEEEVHKPIHEVNLLIQQLKSNTYMSRSTHGHLHHLSTELTRLLSSTRTKMSNPNNVEQCKYCGDSCLGACTCTMCTFCCPEDKNPSHQCIACDTSTCQASDLIACGQCFEAVCMTCRTTCQNCDDIVCIRHLRMCQGGRECRLQLCMQCYKGSRTCDCISCDDCIMGGKQAHVMILCGKCGQGSCRYRLKAVQKDGKTWCGDCYKVMFEKEYNQDAVSNSLKKMIEELCEKEREGEIKNKRIRFFIDMHFLSYSVFGISLNVNTLRSPPL